LHRLCRCGLIYFEKTKPISGTGVVMGNRESQQQEMKKRTNFGEPREIAAARPELKKRTQFRVRHVK
jgi:hypothetical protein